MSRWHYQPAESVMKIYLKTALIKKQIVVIFYYILKNNSFVYKRYFNFRFWLQNQCQCVVTNTQSCLFLNELV